MDTKNTRRAEGKEGRGGGEMLSPVLQYR